MYQTFPRHYRIHQWIKRKGLICRSLNSMEGRKTKKNKLYNVWDWYVLWRRGRWYKEWWDMYVLGKVVAILAKMLREHCLMRWHLSKDQNEVRNLVVSILKRWVPNRRKSHVRSEAGARPHVQEMIRRSLSLERNVQGTDWSERKRRT